MTLPASGTITMQQIANELGVSVTGLSLNSSNVRTLAGVPSGPISFSNLHGKSSVGYPPVNGDGLAITGSGALANCQLNVNRSGTWTLSGDPGGTWLNPQAADSGDTRWVRFDVTSGTLTTGTTGTWQQLNATRSCSKSSTIGSGACIVRVRIATDSSGTTVVSDGSVTLEYDHT